MAVLSAGLVVAGSATAQAADGGYDFSVEKADQTATNSATVHDLFNNQTDQKAGLVAINITAGNIVFGGAEANQSQNIGSTFGDRSMFGSTVDGQSSPWPSIDSRDSDASSDAE